MIRSLTDKGLKLLKTQTIKQSSITFVGTALTGVLGMVFYIVAARYLGPAEFGIFSVAIATLTLVSSLADFGTNTGIVKFTSMYIHANRDTAYRFLKLGLHIKLLVSVFVWIVGYLVVPSIARSFFGKPELIGPLRIAIIGVGGLILFSFSTYALQALQKYTHWTLLTTIMNALRLGGVFVLVYWGIVSTNSILVLYIFFPFLGFVIGLLYLPHFWKVKNHLTVIREFISYNKWVAVFTVISALASRLDTFLITGALTLEDVGIYQVAKTLADIVPQIVFALGIVVAPKLSSLAGDNKKAIAYLKKVQLFVLGLAGAGLALGIPIAHFVIPKLYGIEYSGSIAPFTILLLGQVLFLISVPAHTSVIYYFSYPRLFVYITLVNLLIVAVFGSYFIPIYGSIAAAYSMLVGSITNLLIPGIWVLRRFKNEKA